MSETMKGKTLLKGHTLWAEGDAVGRHYSWSGLGCGSCSCGARSPELPSRAARRRWHAQHKDEIRKSQEQA